MASSLRMLVIALGCIGLGLSEPIVKLDVGSVRGTEMESENGKTFYAFRGIPYAEAPVDELRFRPPVPKLPWGNDPLDATRDGPLCPQIDILTQKFVGQEDNCLVLNMYTSKLPDTPSESLRPVLVYIHGGAFQYGSGSSEMYGPSKLLDNDIVLVTFNYRLGPLGFLSTADAVSPGNYGMLDQVEALKWVKQHVKHVGGDADRITLFGTSAGGASVTYHMISPLSKGLFQRAVALSGSALGPWAYQPEPLVHAQKIGIELGCPVHDTEKMIECLRNAPAKGVTEGAHTVFGWLPIVLCPTLDNNFLPDTPKNLFEKGLVNEGITSFITGVTKHEGEMIYTLMVLIRGPRPFTEKKDVTLALKLMFGTSLHNDKVAELLDKEYVQSLNMEDVEAVREVISKVNSEGFFNVPHYHTAHLVSKVGIPTYTFKYDYQAPFTFNQLFGQDVHGVSHMDDMFMLFSGIYFDHAKFDDKSNKMKKVYQKLLLNFAEYSNPTPEMSDDVPVEWTPVQPDKLWVYHIDDPISSQVYDPKSDPSYTFWVESMPKALEESRKNSAEQAKDEL